MQNIIEEGIYFCNKCERTTMQHRNTKKESTLNLCMHVCMMFLTIGLWVLPLGIYKLFAVESSRWFCKDCGHKN
jgi:hypothetical protein